MNILFVNNSEINPLNSGIQRITAVLAKAFTSRGWNCYGAYFEKGHSPEETLFIEKMKLDYTGQSIAELTHFIKHHRIHRIIVQECWPLKKLDVIHQALIGIPECRLYYCYHSKPGKEFVRPCLNIEFYRFIHSSGKITSLKKILVSLLPPPAYRFLIRKRVRRNYSFIYRTSDKIVLLSESYIPTFLKLMETSHQDTSNFIAIGNNLSYKENIPIDALAGKQKEVLIVSRLSDRAKRISLALKLWQRVEQTGHFPDWRLKILGSGPDEKYYHHLARKLKLQQVDFEGKQNPQSYYRRASIYMLTSAYEGFPLVLTESMQFGVVPIVFDSFSSVHDVIQNGENGIIIPDHHTEEYTETLMRLMNSSEERMHMASHALKDCQRFAEENILQKWITSLTSSEITDIVPQKS